MEDKAGDQRRRKAALGHPRLTQHGPPEKQTQGQKESLLTRICGYILAQAVFQVYDTARLPSF